MSLVTKVTSLLPSTDTASAETNPEIDKLKGVSNFLAVSAAPP